MRKVPMYEFHYDYIKNKYGNKSIIIHRELKLKVFLLISIRIKKCLILVIILVNQNTMIIQTCRQNDI